jgi:hypothetical protein
MAIAARAKFSALALKAWATAAPQPRLMYDSYDGTGIPGNARMVAGYPWWPQSSWNKFAAVPEILVVTSASENSGDVLDCESGDATPDQCGPWIKMRKAAGYFRPTIYCGASNVAAVRQGTGSYVLGTDYDLWIAEWNGSPASAYPGSVAHQYYNQPNQLYDLSSVFDPDWPHRTAGGSSPTPPAARKGPFRQVASGTLSLHAVAVARKTDSYSLATLTLDHTNVANKKAFVAYLTKQGYDKTMPKGLVFYTDKPGGTV